MKKIKFLILLLIVINSTAQTSIESLKGWSGLIPANTYLKDMDNDLNLFEGEYRYSNNGTVFTIFLVKKTMVQNENYYKDVIIGEIEYTEEYINEIINSTPQLNLNLANVYDHLITSTIIIDNNDYDYCTDCTANEIRLGFGMYDTRRGSLGIMRRIIVDGVPAIKLFKRTTATRLIYGQTPIEPIIPDGEYILIKQP